ncbi:MAG: hypothetical protein JXR59_08425 [Desulfuromonadaceae bacterium]|nr:hypothetical protein [Desulfuromonadaceae bacterium]
MDREWAEKQDLWKEMSELWGNRQARRRSHCLGWTALLSVVLMAAVLGWIYYHPLSRESLFLNVQGQSLELNSRHEQAATTDYGQREEGVEVAKTLSI